MKFYGYKNTRINNLLGDTDTGEWVEVNLFVYIGLWICGYMVKMEKQ